MKLFRILLFVAAACIILAGCKKGKPVSTKAGKESTTTGLAYNQKKRQNGEGEGFKVEKFKD